MNWKLLSEVKVSKNTIVDILLANRGILNTSQKEEFLNPHLSHVTIKSVKLSQVECDKAVVRIKKAIEMKESIVVFTDYDADGITAGAILWETIFNLGGKVMPYVPHRVKEGYGMSKKAIDAIHKTFNPTLLITVDHGITAKENTEYAKSLGMDVIILDHHTIPKDIPHPYALIHTTCMCAAGISWFFSNFLRSQITGENFEDLKHNYLDLAVIGTVADLVLLTGPNRVIAYFGLKKINKTERLGLQTLIRESGLADKEIDSYHIGHILAPRINAMGRLTHAIDALRLLCTKNKDKANKLATLLGTTNVSRQQLTKESVEVAFTLVKEMEEIIIIAHEEFNEGIIGLVAGRLVDKYNKPAVVISIGKEFSKASARSIKGFNIVEFFRDHIHLFVDVGGHPMAAGFTIKTEKISLLSKELEINVKPYLQKVSKEKEINVDAKIDFNIADLPFLRKINQLKPFGVGNPEPVFLSKNVTIVDKRFVGKNANHLKLVLKHETTGKKSDAMGFGMGERASEFIKSPHIDVVYRLCENEWQGERKLQLLLLDANISK